MSIAGKFLISCLLACLIMVPVSAAQDKATKEKQLKALIYKITKLKQIIDVKEDSKSRYAKQLKSIERNIGEVSRKIRRVSNKIKNHKNELAGLRKTRLKHQQQLSRRVLTRLKTLRT